MNGMTRIKTMVMLTSALVAIATMGDTCTTNGVTWTYVVMNGKATISGYSGKGICSSGWGGEYRKIVVPATVNDIPVSELGDGLFSYLYLGDDDDNIQRFQIVVEGSIEKIGKGAFSVFYGGYVCCCESVDICFLGDVGDIDDNAFTDMNWNVTVAFNGRVGTLSHSAFAKNDFWCDEYSGVRGEFIVPDASANEFRRRLVSCGSGVTITERSTTYPIVLSTTMREADPTIMDVRFKIVSQNDYVKVRALVFENGERSWSKVVRPLTFVDETGSSLGDHVRANVEHTLSWKVTADWKIELAKAKMEILTMAPDMDLLPLTFITIPANGINKVMKVVWNRITDAQVQNALYWLYASGDSGLKLTNGSLTNGTRAYVFSKLGLTEFSRIDAYSHWVDCQRDDDCYFSSPCPELEYARKMTRLDYLGQAYKWIE